MGCFQDSLVVGQVLARTRKTNFYFIFFLCVCLNKRETWQRKAVGFGPSGIPQVVWIQGFSSPSTQTDLFYSCIWKKKIYLSTCLEVLGLVLVTFLEVDWFVIFLFCFVLKMASFFFPSRFCLDQKVHWDAKLWLATASVHLVTMQAMTCQSDGAWYVQSRKDVTD